MLFQMTDTQSDVLEEHWARNRAPRPPVFKGRAPEKPAAPPKPLMDPVTLSLRGSSLVPQSSRASSPLPGQPALRQRASRNSRRPPTDDNAADTMLRFYDPQWQAVLKDAKNLYRYWLGTENPYPTPSDGYSEAEESIEEAIGGFQREGGVLEGFYFSSLSFTL